MKRWIDILIVALIALLTGCGSETQRPWKTLTECEQANTDLSMQVETLQDENAQLAEQVQTLQELDNSVRFENLNTLEKIRIGKRTGFYDKDDNGTKETLVVYLEPLDTLQDTIKAVGSVKIELWDLETDADKTKPAEWTIEPNELHTLWGGNIFNSYYRIKLPLEIALDEQKEYTVKVIFTDFLSGKVLNDQKVITSQ